MGILNDILIILKSWVAVIIIALIALYIMGNVSSNAYDEEAADDMIRHIEAEYTPDYIGSHSYWIKRDLWYRANCPHTDDTVKCVKSRNYSHIDYMEHRYGKVYAAKQRKEDGDHGGPARFFVIF